MKNIVLLALTLIMAESLLAQIKSIEEALASIEKNNLTLQSARLSAQKKYYEIKTANTPENLNATLFYLPFGEALAGDYWEYQFDQTFAFPTVYHQQNKLLKLQKQKLDNQYQRERQAILNLALHNIYTNISLRDQRNLKQEHITKLEKVLSRIDTSTSKGILAQLRIKLLNLKLALIKTHNELRESHNALDELNGGQTLSLQGISYPQLNLVPDKENLWQKHTLKNTERPKLTLAIANQNYKLSRARSLPNITIGYNYQGYKNDNYRGPLIGLSIPLWGQRAFKKVANLELQINKLNQENIQEVIKSTFDEFYERYTAKEEIYLQYKSACAQLSPVQIPTGTQKIDLTSGQSLIDQMDFYYLSLSTLSQLESELHQLHSLLTSSIAHP